MFSVWLSVTIILIAVIINLFIWIHNLVSRGICTDSAHLVGKVVIVTGSNSGIGFEIAKDAAGRGARVIIAARNEQKNIKAVNLIKEITKNQDVFYHHLDLASFASVRKFANSVIETEKRLDVLINNAGTLAGANETTEDGYSLIMQTNHLGPFLLTMLLTPLLKATAPSRIINTGSFMHKLVSIRSQDLAKGSYNRSFANAVVYSKSKLCNVMLTFELDRRLKGTGVTVTCADPGVVYTPMIQDVEYRIIRGLLFLLRSFYKTAWEGAQTSIYLAVSNGVQNVSGCYFKDCKMTTASTQARDQELAKIIYAESENLCNSQFVPWVRSS